MNKQTEDKPMWVKKSNNNQLHLYSTFLNKVKNYRTNPPKLNRKYTEEHTVMKQ